MAADNIMNVISGVNVCRVVQSVSRLTMVSLLCLFSSPVFAACLGLGFPAPQNTNVCETLVEDLLVPTTELFCNVPIIAPPHCHIPGACHIDPICKTFEIVEQVGSHIVHAGELYCDPREMGPEEIINKLAANLITDTVKLTTGGMSSALYKISAAHVDILECDGHELNNTIKNVLFQIAAKSGRGADDFFGELDVNRVRIIPNSSPTASLYLRDGFIGITLDSVVILRPDLFTILDSWNTPWADVAFGALNQNEHDALLTLVHELIHVRQYRKIGREQFINLYLANAITTDYVNLTTEREARRLESIADNVLSENIAANLSAVVSIINF